jgi:Flp pilus assembly protein TadD
MAYYHKEEYEYAIETFQKALKNGWSQTKIYNNLGLALGKLHRYQEAFEAFSKGGNEAKAYNNLGVLYLADGKYREAIAAFEKAIALDSSYYATAGENLKIAHKALGTSRPLLPPP